MSEIQMTVQKQVENAIRRNAPYDFWSRKEDRVEDIKFASGLTLSRVEGYMGHIPCYTVQAVYGDNFHGFIDFFRDDFHRMLKDENILLFIVVAPCGSRVLVNTEGYGYARYTARIS